MAKVGDALDRARNAKFEPSSTDAAVVTGISDHVASVASFLNRGDIERFLQRLSLLAESLARQLRGQALYVPELDELALRAGIGVRQPFPAPRRQKLLVHVATEVAATGGHTRVIEDIAATFPQYRQQLIVTNPDTPESSLTGLKDRFSTLGLDVHLLQCLRRSERARELSSLICALAPEAVLLFTHPDDSVASVAVQGRSAARVLFFHHSDHQPSLGATRSDYIHVDLTPTCNRFCRSRQTLRASLLNLTVRDVGLVNPTGSDGLAAATCGSAHKYEGVQDFSYAGLLGNLLAGGVTRFVHIGDMPARQMDQIRAEIQARGQDSSRVTFLPNTPSLADKLKEVAPDFYLTSHPIGSGKATVEAMSVGLPILFVCAERTPPLLNPDMTVGNSVPIRKLDQAEAALKRIQTEKAVLAKASRETYEKLYSVQQFKETLASLLKTSWSPGSDGQTPCRTQS